MTLPFSCFICGLARDCAGALSGSLRSVERLVGCFQHADFVVVTNDSDDATAQILTDWAATRRWVKVLNVDGVASAIVGRTERLAVLRNFYLVELRRRLKAGCRYDLMAVVDLDEVNQNLSVGAELGDVILQAPVDWGGLFANQRQAYYDVWALRHPRWCPDDCWQSVAKFQQIGWGDWHFLRRFQTQAGVAARRRYVGERQVKIDPEDEPIEVDSAFGGFAIYKTSALASSWYSGRDSAGHEVCEHVAFNLGIRRIGAKLYIMPALLNDSPAEHLVLGSGSVERPWR